MTRNESMPAWLKVVLAVLAVVVLGPPAIALLGVALAVSLAALAVALKVGVVVLAIAAVVALFRAIFGSSPKAQVTASTSSASIEDLAARMEREERASREALDRELQAAVQHAP